METSDSEIKEEDTAFGNKLHRRKPADGFSRETDAKFEFETLGNQHREALATEGCSQDSDIKLETETHCNHGNQHCETGSRQCCCQRELKAENGERQFDTGAELSVKQERDNCTYFVELADAAHSATTTSTDSHRFCCHGDGGGCHCNKSELCSCRDSHEVKSEDQCTDAEPKVESSENNSLACSSQETELLRKDSSQPDIVPSKKRTIIRTLMSKRKEVSRNVEPCSAENQQAMGPASIVPPTNREIRLCGTQRQGHLAGSNTASLGGKGQERIVVRVITAEAESGDLQPISLTSVQTVAGSQLTALNKAASHQGLDRQKLTGICRPTDTDVPLPLPASALLTSLQTTTGQDSQLTVSDISASRPNQDMHRLPGTSKPAATDLPQPSPAAQGGSHHEGRRLRSSAKKVPPPNIADTPLTMKQRGGGQSAAETSSGQAGGAKPVLIPLLPKPAHRSGGQPTGLSIPLLYLPSHLAPGGQTAVVHGVDTQVTVRLERMPSGQPHQKHQELSLKSQVQSALNARRKYVHMAKRRQRLLKTQKTKSRDTERASASANRQRVFKCQHCPKVCTSRVSFTLHSKVHNRDGPVKCPLCTATFTDVKPLKEHMRTSHPGRSLIKEKEVFRCQHCPKVCTRRLAFVLHSKVHHRDGPVKCDLCTATFYTKESLKEHRRTSHRSGGSEQHVFQCNHCPKLCTSKVAFNRHSKIHDRTDPVVCLTCKATFPNTWTFLHHMRSVHNTGVSSNEASSGFTARKIVKEQKVFECQHCPKACSSKRELYCHVRIHDGKDPFPCSICTATFPSRPSLYQHKRDAHKNRRFPSKVSSEDGAPASEREDESGHGQGVIEGGIPGQSCSPNNASQSTQAASTVLMLQGEATLSGSPNNTSQPTQAASTVLTLQGEATLSGSPNNTSQPTQAASAVLTLQGEATLSGSPNNASQPTQAASTGLTLQGEATLSGSPNNTSQPTQAASTVLTLQGATTLSSLPNALSNPTHTDSPVSNLGIVAAVSQAPNLRSIQPEISTVTPLQGVTTISSSPNTWLNPTHSTVSNQGAGVAGGQAPNFRSIQSKMITQNSPNMDSPSLASRPVRRGGPSSYRCKLCPKTCPSQKGLAQHMVIHDRQEPVSCNLCSATFPNHHLMRTHLSRVHGYGRRGKSCSRSGHTRRGDHHPGDDSSADSVELDSSDEETDAGDWASDDESCSSVISEHEGSTLTETPKKPGSALTETAKQTGSALTETAKQTGSALTETAKQTGSVLTETTKQTGSALTETAKQTGSALTETAKQTGSTLTETAKQTGSTLTETAKQTGSTLTETAKQTGSTLTETAKQTGSVLTETAKTTGSALTETAKTTGSALTETAKQTCSALTETAKQTCSALTETAKQTCSALTDTAKQTCSALTETAKQTGSALTETAKQTGSALTDRAKQTGSALTDRAKQTGSALTDRAKQTGSALTDTAKQTCSTLTDTAEKTGSALTESDTARKTYSAENPYVCCVCDAAFHTLGDVQRHCLEFRHNMGARCGRCSTLYKAKHVARLEVHLQLYCQQKGAPCDGGHASTCVAGSLDTVGQQIVGPREGVSLGDGTSRSLVSVDRPSVPACHSSNVTAPLMQQTGTLTLSLPEGNVTASVVPKTASGPIQQFGTLRSEPGGDSFPSDVVLERQRDYKCPHCPRICPNKTGLVQHMAIHKRGGSVKCGLCSATFISDRCRKKHLKRVHRISWRYLTVNSISMRYLLGSSSRGIDTDNTEATDLVGLGQGGDTADGPTHSDVRVMTGKDRDLHMTSSDLDVAPVSGKKSVKNSASDGIPFSTDIGSGTSRENVKSFEGSIRREMKSSGRVRFCCDQCPWKFLKEYRYHLHMVSHLRHEEIERYIFVCPFCKEARFKTERAVDYHVDNRWCGVVKAILKMTKQMPRVPENIEVMCSACRGVYSSLRAYGEHAKGTGCSKRAFRCVSCAKSYVYNSSLLAHRRLCHPDTATSTVSATAASDSTAGDEDTAEGNVMDSQHQSEQSMIEDEMQSSDSSPMNAGEEDKLPGNVTASQHQHRESTSALNGGERQSSDSSPMNAGDDDKLLGNVTASQQRHKGSTMTQSAREMQSRQITSMLSESVMKTAGEEKSMSTMLSESKRYAGQTSQYSDGMHTACEEVENNGEESLSEGDDGDGGLVLECETEPGSPTESLFSTGTAQDETEIWSRAGQQPTHQDCSSDEGGEPLAGETQHRDNDLQVSKPGVKGSATVPRRKRQLTDDDEDDDDHKIEDDDDAIESSKSSPVKQRRKRVQSPLGKRQRGEDDDWLPDKSRSQGGHGKAKADLQQPGSRSQRGCHKAGANPYPPPPGLVQRPTLFVCAPGSGPLPLLSRPPPGIEPRPGIRPPPSIQPTSVTRFPVYLLQNQLVARTPLPTQNLVSGQKPFNVLNPPGSRSLLATQNTQLTLNTPASQSSFTVQSPVTVIRQPVAQNPFVVLKPLTVQSPMSVQSQAVSQSPQTVQSQPVLQISQTVQSQPVLQISQTVQSQPHPRSLLRRGKKSRPK